MGDWDEPDPEALAEAIISIQKNRDKYRKQAFKNSGETAAFNWDTAANQLLQIVKPSSNRVTPDWKPLEPITTVQVNRAIKATIGDHYIDLKPGKPYDVVLNVRNVLRSAGYLVEKQ
jgi:hypothetical protein